MKVILYAAITVNGYISSREDDTSWISEEEWKNFRSFAKKSGNVIIGRRTYDLMEGGAELIDGCLHVVITSHPLQRESKDRVTSVKTPQEALSLLKSKNVKQVCVAGGGMLNGSFLKENLVDEIYLDIEPEILGQGIPVFAPTPFEQKLELLEVNNISTQTIQLHYRVIK